VKIIVVAHPNDNHTEPIKWALEKAGYKVVCWAGLSWTEAQHASLLLDDQSRLALGPHLVEPGDTVWIRRPDSPAHNPKVSEADKKFAELEYRAFYQCAAYTLELLPVRVINRYSASRVIHNKSVQLHMARLCGLKVPRTLLSNSPTGVKGFFDHNKNRTICKTFAPHIWQRQEAETVAITETFELKREELPADHVLTYAPAIYQDMVVKQFDVRTVLMGNRVYSYALHNPLKALDWRQDAGMGKIEVEIVPTPPDVERGILEFVRRAGICFGSIDFAVDMDGQWWFLEINEQGQFLWLDEFNHDVKIQEKFCAFLTAPEGLSQPLEEREGLFPSFAEYKKAVDQHLEPPDPATTATSPQVSMEP
jgi:hypothetical protein